MLTLLPDLQKILGQDKKELDISIEVYKEGKWDPRRFILTGFDGSTEWMKISLFIGSCSKTTEHDWEILDEERIVVTFRQDIGVCVCVCVYSTNTVNHLHLTQYIQTQDSVNMSRSLYSSVIIYPQMSHHL